MDDAEHGGASANAEGECKHGDEGEAGILEQLAKGESEIIHGGVLPLVQRRLPGGLESRRLGGRR